MTFTYEGLTSLLGTVALSGALGAHTTTAMAVEDTAKEIDAADAVDSLLGAKVCDAQGHRGPAQGQPAGGVGRAGSQQADAQAQQERHQ